MMTDDEVRKALEGLIVKYLKGTPDFDELLIIIRDKKRPGLPIRGVLESMRQHRKDNYSQQNKDAIEELIYMYG